MQIDQTQIFWPMLAQIGLTVLVFFVLASRKEEAIKSGNEDPEKSALDNKAWNESVVKASNNIDNQFQTPVLFYTLCFMLYHLEAVTIFSLSLAWAYAVSRFVHAYIHLGSNYVPNRLRVFLFGFVMLILMLGVAFLKMVGV
ncbi:MAG: MAPEG family protein [Ketobacteraceae bacterium]|nr:MAPEG family protein [Ketobacteraceae bacterium]